MTRITSRVPSPRAFAHQRCREGLRPFAVAAADVGVTEHAATGPEIIHRAGVPTSAPDERLLRFGEW
ncbi:MAG: hypothetical protein ACYCST_00125 [Acidimicrobiales bacterium]